MRETRISAERVLPVSRAEVWSLIADPSRHHEFDASGMVGGLANQRPQAPGDVFRMNMTYRSAGAVENYQSDNHVIRFEPEQTIEWATALPDVEPLGWTWTYELADAPEGTRVCLTFDWTRTPAENVHRFGVPLTDERGLAASLALLERACGSS